MKRSFVLLSLAALASAAPLASTAQASNVHVGVGLSVPFEHGVLGVAFGDGPGCYVPGPYLHSYHRRHRHFRPAYGSCGPWLPPAYVAVQVDGRGYARDEVEYDTTIADEEESYSAPAMTVSPVEPERAVAPAVFLPRSTDMSGALQLRLNGRKYFYDGGLFFQKTSAGYLSTTPPIGAVAQHLPGDAEAMMLGEREYFTSGPAVFSQVRNGFMLVDG